MSARVQKHGIEQALAASRSSAARYSGRCSDCTRTAPSQSRPSQRRSSRIAGRVFRAAAARIDVLQAQQEAPAGLARPSPGEQRRVGAGRDAGSRSGSVRSASPCQGRAWNSA